MNFDSCARGCHLFEVQVKLPQLQWDRPQTANLSAQLAIFPHRRKKGVRANGNQEQIASELCQSNCLFISLQFSLLYLSAYLSQEPLSVLLNPNTRSNTFVWENRKFSTMATLTACDISAEGEEQRDLEKLPCHGSSLSQNLTHAAALEVLEGLKWSW